MRWSRLCATNPPRKENGGWVVIFEKKERVVSVTLCTDVETKKMGMSQNEQKINE